MPTPAITRSGLKTLPIRGSVPYTTVQSLAVDSAAMLDLHQWLNRRRFRLFGDLRPWDQQDAVEETFIRTLEFADKVRDPGALYGACFTIGLRVRAQRVTEYIRERCSAAPGVVPLVPWHPERRLSERDRRTGALIRRLRASDQEILPRFYFKGQTQEQIQLKMQADRNEVPAAQDPCHQPGPATCARHTGLCPGSAAQRNGAGLAFILFKGPLRS